MKKLVALSILVMALSSCRTANVPSALPDGYVPTPHGLVHHSCVHAVPRGHRVGHDGTLTDSLGNHSRVAPCRYPRLDAQTHRTFANNPQAVSGWVASARWGDTVGLSSLNATFVVPPAPTDTGALIYIYPAMTPAGPVSILQPVLQYGYSAANGSGGNYWTVTSWFCCGQHASFYGNSIQVNPGDTIVGSIAMGCQSTVCVGMVTGTDTGTGGVSQLEWSSPVPSFPIIYGGVLEVYRVNDCSQFPPSPITFTNVVAQDLAGNTVQPVWTYSAYPQLPGCGYTLSSTPTTVTLSN